MVNKSRRKQFVLGVARNGRENHFVANSEGAQLIPELRSIPNLVFVPKNNYSCFAKSNLLQVLQNFNIGNVYVCGINTDYCVFATTMSSYENQFRTYVVKDAVTTVRGREAHEEGLRNLERHFSANVFVTTDNIINTQRGRGGKP